MLEVELYLERIYILVKTPPKMIDLNRIFCMNSYNYNHLCSKTLINKGYLAVITFPNMKNK